VFALATVFALPGVVVHELGHYLLCRLCGARVQEVVFFRPDEPGGHVVHTVPKRLAQHAVIVVGPLLLNSTLAFLLFRAAVTGADPAEAELLRGLPWPSLQVLLALALGLSIGLQAIPSHADARSLWNVTLDRLRHGHLLAVLAVPGAAGLILVNALRRFWIDWLYVGALAGLAIWFPVP
jgi:Putative zincin peptidase